MRFSIRKIRPWMWGLALLLLVGGVAAAARPLWLPLARRSFEQWLAKAEAPATALADEHAGHDHEGHDHGHAGHSEDSSIELSANGLKNIGFRPVTIELGAYTRRIDVPAMVVERPGRTQMQISAPLTGVVTRIFPVEGAAVGPGSPLFEVRLTHEELVASQSNLIRTAENLDVVNREIARLESLSEGIVAGKRILEQQYEKQKLEASLRAERQALLLHGLSEEHVEAILQDRELFRKLTVRAPEHSHESEACRMDHYFHVQSLPIKSGQQVQAGQVLGVLADHCELYIEGRAFEDDALRLRQAAREGWPISASLLVGDRETDRIDGLKLLYLADHVDAQSRAFRFYLALPNEVVLEQESPGGHRFLEWRFKPGQRMELHVPVEQWEERIVLPVEAVVDEGAETYVYQQNGDHFDRVAVHVEQRDQSSVVIANNGAVFPGDVVAARGAYEMHLALKNKAGGGIDPHAGHNH